MPNKDKTGPEGKGPYTGRRKKPLSKLGSRMMRASSPSTKRLRGKVPVTKAPTKTGKITKSTYGRLKLTKK